LVVTFIDRRDPCGPAPLLTILALHEKERSRRGVAVVRVEGEKARPFRGGAFIPDLKIGKIGDGSSVVAAHRMHLFKCIDVVGLLAPVNIGRPRPAVRGRENPNATFGVERYDGIVVRVGRFFIQQEGRTRDGLALVVEVRDHVQELAGILLRRAAIAEKGLFHRGRIDRERLVHVAVGAQASAVLVGILIAGGLIHIPDAAITVGFLVERE
jgi:hypothetical protein